MNFLSKISPKLYLNFISENPQLFFVAAGVATCPFLFETAGILSLIPLLQSDEQDQVTLPLFFSESTLTLSTLQMILVLMTLFTLQWIFSTAKVFLATAWSNALIKKVKQKLFEKLQHKDPIETMNQNKGTWIQLFQTEFKNLGLALISCIYLTASFIFTCFTLWLLWKISPDLSLALIPLGIVIGLSIVISNKLVHHYGEIYQKEQQREASFLLENWKHPIIQLLHQTQQWLQQKYQQVLGSTQQAYFYHFSYTFSSPHWTRWVIFMCILVLLALHYLMPSENRMATPTLITYLIVLSRLQPITYTLSHDLANLVTGQIAWRAIESHIQSAEARHQGEIDFAFEKEICVKQLTFRYPTRQETLGPHEFKIPKGQTYGIYGISGSGKSTLMNCLMGIFEPRSGCVRIDEKDLQSIHLPSYWSKVAYVPQEADFLQLSLRENLCLGQSYPDQKIMELCQAWGLESWVHSLPHGLDEMLYPDAKNLSGGQKKKVMMVRALLRNPEILFLDEPCSGLDQTSKQAWMENLKQLPQNLTTIIITHDSDLLELCQNVYKT